MEHHRTLHARQDTRLHTLQINRGDVGGDDDLLAQQRQVIEDIEEGLLRLLLANEPLDIVDDEDVHLLVEVDEAPAARAVEAVAHVLHLELGAGHIAHAHRAVQFHGALPYGLA